MSIASEITRLQNAKASIKTAIEGQGVTVPSSTTLDGYATLIDSISGGGGGGSVDVASGTFTGDGTSNTKSFSVSFAPDIVVVQGDLDIETAGWVGIFNIVIIKNTVAYQSRHNTATSTGANMSANAKMGGNYPEYGDNSTAYTPYGTYSNGVFTVADVTNNAITRFVSGAEYTWVAIKYTQNS